MSLHDKAELLLRLKNALENFEKKATKEQIEAVHKMLEQHSDSLFKSPDLKSMRVSEFSLIKSLMEDKLDEHKDTLKSKLHAWISHLEEEVKKTLGIASREFYIGVSADGDILGDGKYETFDIGWAEAFIVWLEHYFDNPSFPTPGPWIEIPDTASFAIFGDWGGGTWKGNKVATVIADLIHNNNPDYCIHLGDVYYTGETKNEQEYLLALWPKAQKGNFTLNSNHEMYPAGQGYFETALANDLFEQQNGKSYFALENSHWIIVGLDSAFSADKNHLYLVGAINDEQEAFLQDVKAKNKPVIAMCHHNPLDLAGASIVKSTNPSTQKPLWEQVYSILGDNLKYWYWGHAHAAAVYQNSPGGVNCRLCGHGVIPWGHASNLADAMGQTVIWYENKTPTPPDSPRVQNGFAILSLNGEEISETFYGEDGTIHWPT